MVRWLFVLSLITVQLFGQQIKFENFTTSQGLSNNSVIDIENDKNGGLWIATWDGLNYYDGHTFTIFKHNLTSSSSISSNYITKLKRDHAGYIWLISCTSSN